MAREAVLLSRKIPPRLLRPFAIREQQLTPKLTACRWAAALALASFTSSVVRLTVPLRRSKLRAANRLSIRDDAGRAHLRASRPALAELGVAVPFKKQGAVFLRSHRRGALPQTASEIGEVGVVPKSSERRAGDGRA
jgi:hypothetical protein